MGYSGHYSRWLRTICSHRLGRLKGWGWLKSRGVKPPGMLQLFAWQLLLALGRISSCQPQAKTLTPDIFVWSLHDG